MIKSIIKKIYTKFILMKEYLLGIEIDEKEEKRWENRHINDGHDWINRYWNNRDLTSKHFLVNKIENFSPLSSVLEVGCNCGPNLYLVAKKFPQAKIKGIDINSGAVEIGNNMFAQEGIPNVELSVGRANNLQFPEKNFDLVFTNAVLVHIGPSKIEGVIKEMLRVAKKGLVLMEWYDKDATALGTRLGYSYRWKRDYRALLKKFVKEDQIHLTKIPWEVWPGEDWGKIGYVIEVTL